MKKKNILLSSTALLSILSVATLGAQNVSAQTYTSDGLGGTSNGKIEFITGNENDKGVPDPGNPDKPVMPPEDPDRPGENPLNPSTADLRLMYVPNLEFGKHAKSTAALTAQAALIPVKDVDPNTLQLSTTTRDVVPFVTTYDMRTNRSTGWTVSVKASDFTDGSHTINGAAITLSNLNYADSATTPTSQKPLAKSGSVTLTSSPVNIAAAAAASNQGVGKYTLALGKVSGTTTDGVTFNMPANTSVNTATYTSTLTWNLAPQVNSL